MSRNHQRELRLLSQAILPLAHLCIKSGIGVAEINLALKLACIEAAAGNARIANRLNHSRISAITGLTRKEVRSLEPILFREELPQVKARAKHRAARVLQGWKEDPEFQTTSGDPAQLRVRGQGTTFHALARRYGGDVTPLSILKELQRLGAVTKPKKGRVKIKRATLQERTVSAEAVTDFSRLLRDFGFSALAHVQALPNSAFLGYREIADISQDEAALFSATFSERAASFIDSTDRWKASQNRMRLASSAKISNPTKVGLGVYLVDLSNQPAPVDPIRKRSSSARTISDPPSEPASRSSRRSSLAGRS